MIIINKGQQNELILNINNNSRQDFSTYTLRFTHVLSQEIKNYTIATNNSNLFGENDRYCEIILNLQNDDLNYEGQYNLQIFGDSTNLVYTNIARLVGTTEDNSFISYESPNEDGANYIYIEE